MQDAPLSNATSATTDPIITTTRAWLEQAVIGLNLCPFAKAVYHKQQIRYRHSTATDSNALLHDLCDELQTLASADPSQLDTTLLIHPHVFNDFLEYNDFLAVVDVTIANFGLEGTIQVASFHPRYQFADSAPNDIENYTNRSPYPMLHLLREASITRALAALPDADRIVEKNQETLRKLGLAGWQALPFVINHK